MTDDKIIKSLKWLVFNFPKIENPEDDADKMCNCINLYCQNAIDTINRQKAEIKKQRATIKHFKETKKMLRAEVETLQKGNPFNEYGNRVIVGDALVFTKTLAEYDKLLQSISAEGIKDFAERLKAKALTTIRNGQLGVIDCYDIDNLVKEMTENDFKE